MHWTQKKLGLLGLLGFLFLACEGPQQPQTPDLPAAPQEKETNRDNQALFAAFVANLPKAKLPYEKPLDWQGEDMGQPLDSQSVVRYIDSLLFESECSCQYYQGIVLLEKAQYTAIAFPLDWNAGTSIELRTYTKEGKQIDYFEFVKAFETSLASYLTEEGLIRRLTIDHDLESPDQAISNKSRQVAFFQISPTGKIQPTNVPKESADAWIGQWQRQTTDPASNGTLDVLPDKHGHLSFHFYHNGDQTRDFAGLALVEGKGGNQAASLSHGCLSFFKEEKGIRVVGNCIESLGVDFSGIYLNRN